MICVESFEVTYPPIFKCFKAIGGVIIAQKCRVWKILKIWGFWVTWAFGPNCGFFLGFRNDLPPHF